MDLLYVVLLILFGVLFLVAEIVLLPGVSVGALLALGIPARKVPRVQAELARLSARTPLDPAALPELARQIARQLC